MLLGFGPFTQQIVGFLRLCPFVIHSHLGDLISKDGQRHQDGEDGRHGHRPSSPIEPSASLASRPESDVPSRASPDGNVPSLGGGRLLRHTDLQDDEPGT